MGQTAAVKFYRSTLAQTLRDMLEPLGMFDARLEEFGSVRAMAAALIGPGIASEEVLKTVFAHTGYGIYLVREEGRPTGVVALIMLNATGLAAVEADLFDPLEPHLDCVALPHEAPTGVYAWGIAAATREAAKVAVAGAWATRSAAPNIPFFVRAATDAGRRLLTEKMPFTLYPGTTTDLLWWEHGPVDARRAA
jgi:hypothetical protein